MQTTVDKMISILPEKDSKNTERSTKQSVKAFYDYLVKKNLTEPPNDNRALSELLKCFYQDARKADGSHYSKNSLQSLRYGLCRHFRTIREIDIITDADFAEANKSYQARCIFLKEQGLDKVDHKPQLLEEDLKQLYQSGVFDLKHPKTLQNKVFFEIMLFFCRRYGQNPRELKASDFEFRIDNKGRRFVCRAGYKVPENRPENEDALEVMYEKWGPYCPVASLDLYIKRLNPNNPYLFQRPRKVHLTDDEAWYDSVVYGERVLCEKMKLISEEAKLSNIFSNHSIRIVSISVLNKCIFGSVCPWVAQDRSKSLKATVKRPEQSAVARKRKISETRVDVDESMSRLQQRHDDPNMTGWQEYRTSSGQVLLIKIAEKSPSISMNGSLAYPLSQTKNLVSTGTQTEDTGCINGCTSKHIPPYCDTHVPITQASRTVYEQPNVYTHETTTQDNDHDNNMEDISDDNETSYASDLTAVLKVLDESDSNNDIVTTNHQPRGQSLIEEKPFCVKRKKVSSNDERNVLNSVVYEKACVVLPASKGDQLKVGNPGNLASNILSQYLDKLTCSITPARAADKSTRTRNTLILPKPSPNTSMTPIGNVKLITAANKQFSIKEPISVAKARTPKSLTSTSNSSASSSKFVCHTSTMAVQTTSSNSWNTSKKSASPLNSTRSFDTRSSVPGKETSPLNTASASTVRNDINIVSSLQSSDVQMSNLQQRLLQMSTPSALVEKHSKIDWEKS